MTNAAANRRELSPNELLVRAAVFLVLVVAAVTLRLIHPETLASLPFRTSCGAQTGLPCIFCGMTRALHHLLNGELARALYFNWIAVPFAASILVTAFRLSAEMIGRRQIPLPRPPIRITRHAVACGAAVVFAVWILQVSLAISQHKRELLNPNGVLYALVGS